MNRFSSTAAAKEFLVSRILHEADRSGVNLSHLERTMLFFSETTEPTPQALQAAATFENDQDIEAFEKKLTRLIRKAHSRDRKSLPDGKRLWKDAVKSLREGDHYLLVLVDEALGQKSREGDWWRLPVSGLVVAILLVLGVGLLKWFDENYWFSETTRLVILVFLAVAALAIVASGVAERVLRWLVGWMDPALSDSRGKRPFKS